MAGKAGAGAKLGDAQLGWPKGGRGRVPIRQDQICAFAARFVSRKRDGCIVMIWPAYARGRAQLGPIEQGRIESGARHDKGVAISAGNKNGLGYQPAFDNNKNRLVSPCVNSSTF